MKRLLLASCLGGCVLTAVPRDGGADTIDDGPGPVETSVDPLDAAFDFFDTGIGTDDAWMWSDANVAPDVGPYVAPASCDLGDPIVTLGTYPTSFARWPDSRVYEMTIVGLRTSNVHVVSASDIDHTLVAQVNGLTYSPDPPSLPGSDAGPSDYVGTELTVELPDLVGLALGDHLYVGNIGYFYNAEAPNLLVAGEAVLVAAHPMFLDDLQRARAYDADAALYERLRHAESIVLAHVHAVSGPFDCQFMVAYDYQADLDVDRLLCGTSLTGRVGVHTGRLRLDSGAQEIFVLQSDTPSACSFPPGPAFGSWAETLRDELEPADLGHVVQVLTHRPELAL